MPTNDSTNETIVRLSDDLELQLSVDEIKVSRLPSKGVRVVEVVMKVTGVFETLDTASSSDHVGGPVGPDDANEHSTNGDSRALLLDALVLAKGEFEAASAEADINDPASASRLGTAARAYRDAAARIDELLGDRLVAFYRPL